MKTLLQASSSVHQTRPQSADGARPSTQLFLDSDDQVMLSAQSSNLAATEVIETEARRAELDQLERAVADVQRMFDDMKQVVASQQPSIDQIEQHIERTRDNVDRGGAQLRQAAQHVGSALIGGLVGAAIGGPVGLVAVGAVKAATVFAASGALVGAAAANTLARFQRREAEIQEQELAEYEPGGSKDPLKRQ